MRISYPIEQHLEVASVLELGADAFGIFFEFGSVVGFGEDVLKKDGVWMPMGLRFFMAARSVRSPTCLLPRKRMRPTLTLGPSLMTKVTPTAAGGIGRHFGADGGELASMLGEQFLEGRTSAFLIFVGSYWFSTASPTLRSLNRSSTSLVETAFRPV